MKLPSISGGELVKRLTRFGFVVSRRKGSHVRLEKNVGDKKTIKITVPLHKVLKKGTLHSIIKVAGLTEEEFEVLK
ncbi:type II toxin-antitoxin system HicA family toxin [Candidatus Woesearchaeota archaeon]|nr:type II toxin-antitoxin system HicA family toxin [Candidatus Woesearchaeota archaeon]